MKSWKKNKNELYSEDNMVAMTTKFQFLFQIEFQFYF